MHVRDHGLRERVAAIVVSLSFLVVLLGAAGAFAADSDDGSCVGCPGCDAGKCDDDVDPLTSHHHCCTTSCLSHATVTLLTAQMAPDPVIVGPMARSLPVAVTGRPTEPPYRPPRP
jgi:hypothetical protein